MRTNARWNFTSARAALSYSITRKTTAAVIRTDEAVEEAEVAEATGTTTVAEGVVDVVAEAVAAEGDETMTAAVAEKDTRRATATSAPGEAPAVTAISQSAAAANSKSKKKPKKSTGRNGW